MDMGSIFDSVFRSEKFSPVQLGAAVVSLIAVGLAASWGLSSSASSGEELAPALTEDEALGVMTAIFDKVKVVAAKMVRAAENVKQQIAAQGQEIEDKKLMQTFILPHFETSYREIQQQALDDADVEESELEEAVNEYMKQGHQPLIEIYTRIRLIYKEFGGDCGEDGEVLAGKEQEGADEITHDMIILVLQKLAERMNAVTLGFIHQFKEQYGSPNSPTVQAAFQQGMLSLSEEAEKAVLAEFGISPLAFQQALLRNQDSQEIGEVIMKMQIQNQKLLMQNGIERM